MRSLIFLLLVDPKFQKTRFCVAIVTFMLVLVLGSIPGARATIGIYYPGIVLHAGTYSFITLCLFGGTTGTPRRRAAISWLLVAAMGALDEYVQSFLSYRSADIRDWSVDIAAALCCCLVAWMFWPAQLVRVEKR